MVTDGIMKIIWDMQEEVQNKISKLKHGYKIGNMYKVDVTPSLNILEAKLSVLSEIEEKLGNYEE